MEAGREEDQIAGEDRLSKKHVETATNKGS
jgi:hypothetical protein